MLNPGRPDGTEEPLAEAAALEQLYGQLRPQEIIARTARDIFPGSVAVVSSFGADSAVLLHMIAEVDRTLPVLFLDTGKHFDETLQYRAALVADFGLTNVRTIGPDAARLVSQDPDGKLHRTNADLCCSIRKVEPMARAIQPFRAWMTGRKRYQSRTRSAMPVFEDVGGRIRINPLAHWTTTDQASYMREHALRSNPLVAYGYLSIGCLPCTEPVRPGDDARSGRWAGNAKVECGIHLSGLDQSLTDASL
jgi:phosphoadenosine phosphosulfate reductase